MRKMYSVLPAQGRLIITLLLAIIGINGYAQSTVLISPTGDGGFESGATFAANGWTLVSSGTNQWFVGGVSTPSAGTNAAYVSDNATGTTYTYNTNSSNTVHFYRDITFPAGQTDIVLTFKWKGQGESSYDYLTVFSMPTTLTPAVNSPAAGFQSWLNFPTAYPGATIHTTPPNLNLQGAYQTQTICLPASYAGTTRRLVFTWTNDGIVGTQPPASVDEISLISTTPNPPAAQPTSLVLTPMSTSQIDGSFTAAAGSPTYLVVAYPTGATPVAPANGSSYAVGSTIGTGTVVYNGTATTFNATGLSGSTTYDFYIYSYTALPCAGNQYLTTSPLMGTATTNTCGGLAGGTYTVGPTGTYPTLTAAVAATAVGMTGPVVLELQPSYSSGGETYPIVFAYNACIGPVNTLTIRPAAGAVGLSISGDNATAIFDFNGGDYVTIDGRPGGTGTAQELSVINTNTTGVAVRFTNDAKQNTLRYLDLQGASNVTPTTATLAGVVYFAGAGTEGTGNDNNTIANCKIHSSSGGPTAVGIYGFGSTTTVSSYNDNNTVTNCEIYDFFKTGAFSSTGLKLDAGNNAWTITNNHFYQTAPVAYTAAATHRAIWITPNVASINNTASGFIITGNFIGGSGPSLAAPAYTMSGAFNYAFMGMDISVGLGTATSIQNNTIGNIVMTANATSTTALVGISVVNGNVNVGTVTGNTIGSMTTNSDIVFTTGANSGGVMGIRVAGGTGNTINVANNMIGGIDLNGSTTSFTTNFTGIAMTAGTTVNITNNTIGSPNVANSINMVTASTSTTAGQLNGITVSSGTTTTVNGNIIANINSNIAYTGTGTAVIRGILVSSSATSINNNIVRNLSTSSSTTATGANSALVGIAMTSTNTAGANVTGNTIDSLVLTSANATAAIQVTGLFFSGTATVTNNISKNFIHSFDFANANPNIFFTGIDNAAGANNIVNNMIRLGVKPDGTDYMNDNVIRGISSNSTSATNVYHNSVYIGGANVGSNAKNTLAFTRTATSGTYDIRNNIFVNNRSNASAGAGGKHYVFVFATGTTGVTINNNLYQYTGNDGTFAGYTGTTPPPDVPVYVAGWIPSDAASIVGNPQFIAPDGTASTVNLHIHPTNPTPIEGGGANIAAVTDDFDGQARSGLTPTDIGADAGNFVILDIAPPVITYTPLGSACNTADRTLTANISDGGGLPTTGSLVPRIYFKKSTSGTWSSAAGTLTSGTANNGTWDFVISGAAMGGVANLDQIEYYIIAQDNAGNIGSFPGGVTATNVNTVTAHPATPATYSIANLSGSYDVGSASVAPFNTLTAAVNFYNTACLTGAVTFNLTDAVYDATTETFPISVNANTTASATNTLTIKPSSGNTVAITGASTSSLLKLNGADFVIINGSNNGTTSRDLTIANTSTATNTAAIWISSLGTGAGATNDTIRNTIVKAGSRTVTSTFGIHIGGTTISTSGTGNDNDNIAIINDSISFAYFGIYARATSAAVNNDLSIIGNSIGSETATEYIGKAALDIQQASGANISMNTISNIIGTITNPTGMLIGAGVTNSSITRNNIRSIHYTGTGGYGGRGMDINTGSTTSNLTISNNMIAEMKGDGWSSFTSDAILGIRILGTTGGINLYHNSISLGTGSFAGSTSGTVSGALYVASTVTALDVRNNIFYTNLVNTNAPAAKTYAIYSDAPSSAFTNINNNNYYVEGSQGVLGYIAATPRLTLADIQTGFGQNTNSVSMPIYFVSLTDLHLDPAQNATIDNLGTPVGVTVDIDGDARSATTPDIGADEFSAPACTGAVGGTASAPTMTYCNSGTPVITATGYSTGAGSTYQWQSSNDNFVSNVVDISGQTIPNALTLGGPVTTTTYYRLKVTCTSGTATAYSNILTITINPNPTVTITPGGSTTFCPGNSVVLTASGTANTYTWSPATGLSATTGASVTANPTMTTTYTVTGEITATGCTNTANVTITVHPAVTMNSVTATPANVCSGGTSQLEASATVGYPEVKITEITLFRAGTGPTNPYPAYIPAAAQDFVEISNISANSKDVSGLVLEVWVGTAINRTYTIPAGTIIPANSVMVVHVGTGTDDAANRYFNTGGTTDGLSSATAGGFVLKSGAIVIDAVATNSYAWPVASGVVAADWSGNIASSSGLAGVRRTAATDNNTAANWTLSSAANPQNIGTYNGGFTPVTVSLNYAWTPNTFLSNAAIANPVASNVTATTAYTVTATEGTTGCSATGNVTVTVDPPSVGGTVAGAQTVCIGNSPTTDLVLSGHTGAVVKWQSSADAAFTSPTDIASTSATLTGAVIGAVNQNTYFRAVVKSGACAEANSASVLITVDATVTNSTPLAGTAGGAQACANYSVSTANNYMNNCNLIATVVPSGASPVSGNINACVKIEASVPTATTGEAYVARHYTIVPATNPATATSTITLYFLQSEFTAFNAANTFYPDLPVNGSDAAGKANLRVSMFPGASNTPGAAGGVQINPVDADVVFNAAANRWEVTFAATGSGSFFVHTGNFVLPVTLLEFNGYIAGDINKLNWKTSTETNNRGFELQRSADGVNFSGIAFINSKAENGNSTSALSYGYDDAKPIRGNSYYRLKQVDKDGKIAYSKTILLSRKVSDITLTSVYPNPAERELNLMITSPKAEKVTVIITDLRGKTVMQHAMQLMTGENQKVFNVQALAAGTYIIKVVCGEGCETAVQRFVKQ